MRVFLSRFILLIGIAIVVCGLFVALLPTLMNTSWGRQQVVYLLNRKIPGKVAIRTLHLSWGKGQKVEGFLLKDPEGQPILKIEQMTTEATLWQLLSKSAHLGFTQIQELNATIGEANLQRALGLPYQEAPSSLAPSPITLSDVNADFLFDNQHPLSAHIRGLTQQGNLNGSFDIHLSLNGLQVSKWEKFEKEAQSYLSVEGSKEAKAQAKIVHFPVALLDDLISLKKPHLSGLFHSLLGDYLNLTIDKENSHEGLVFNLAVLSPLMQGDVKGEVVDGVLTLLQPAMFNFNLTPEFVNPFVHPQFQLPNISQLKVAFPSLSFPFIFLDDKATVDPSLLGFEAEVSLSGTDIVLNPMEKLNIHDFKAHLNFPFDKKSVQLQLAVQAQQSGESFNLHLDSMVNKPRNLSSLLEQLKQSFSASLKVAHFPLQLIPSLNLHPEWIKQIGPHANAQLIVMPNKEGELELTLSLETAQLVLKKAQFAIGKEIILKSPAQLTWSGNADCFNRLFKADQNQFLLDEPCSLQFKLKQFRLPLDHPTFTKIQLESMISPLKHSKLFSWGTICIQDLALNIEGNLNEFNSEVKGKLSFLTSENQALQSPLSFSQTSNWKIGPSGTIEMPVGRLQCNNSICKIQAEGRLTSNHELTFTQPVHIEYTLSPLSLKSLSQSIKKDWPTLQEDAHISLRIDPASLYLNAFHLSTMQLQGTLTVDRVALKDASGALSILNEISIPWGLSGETNHFYANIKGLAFIQKNTKPGRVSGHCQFWLKPGYYDAAHTKAELHMNFAGMPTSMLNMLLLTHDLSPVLGPIIDLNFKTFYDPFREKPGYCHLQLDSEQLHINGRFKLDDVVATLDGNKPATIRLTLTPESIDYLKKIFHFKDDRPTPSSFTLLGNLSRLYIPLKTNFLDQCQLDFQFSSTDIRMQEESIKIEGQFNSQNLREQIHFTTRAHSSSPSLTLQGTLSQLFDQKNKIHDWQEVGLNMKLQGRQLTPTFLQHLFILDNEQAQKFKAFFGESIELNAACQLQNFTGPIEASTCGEQGEIHFDGQIHQGILKLNNPLEGFFKINPHFSQVFLEKNIPILSTAIGAENPIKFKIDQLTCPLLPFKLEQMAMSKGVVDLAKISFRNEGELSSFLSAIRAHPDPFLTIWFTPLYFDLNEGILNLKRMDMLIANAYELASWGDINLHRQQADLIMGLSAQSLRYAFGINGLDKEYVLQIPVHSENGEMKINKKKLTGRISALIAQTQGGSTGKLLGSILDMALNKDESFPPPTTSPFPWKDKFIPSSASSAVSDTQAPEQAQESLKETKKKKHKHKS